MKWWLEGQMTSQVRLSVTALRLVAASHGLLNPVGGRVGNAMDLWTVPEPFARCRVATFDCSGGSVEPNLSDKYVGEQFDEEWLRAGTFGSVGGMGG